MCRRSVSTEPERFLMRCIRVLFLAVFAPCAALAQNGLPRSHAPRPTSPAITASDLMTRLYILADDSMQGREAGTVGNVRATDYIAAELRRLGLVPAGDSGGYFQTIPLKTRTFDTTSTFAASGKLVVLVARRAFTTRQLRGSSPELGGAAYAVIGLDSVPQRFLGFLRRPATFVDDRVGPVTAAPVFLISRAAAARMFTAPLEGLTPGTPGATAAVAVRFDVAPVPFSARNVVGIVPGRDPVLKGEYVAVGGHNDHVGMTRAAVDHDSLRIWNHVVRPEGADDGGRQATPAQQARVDSLLAAFRAAHPGASRPDTISNGADDDGSGTVAVLEIAERIATLRQKPKRSTLFVFHTGEEKGLLGSRYFTDHPTVPREAIVAQLNLDMVGRGGSGDETGRTKDSVPLHGGPAYLQLVGTRRLSTELGDLIEQVNASGGHKLTFDYSLDANGHQSNIYCRSDHYEYARFGIPIAFFTTGLHSDYHQVTDEPQYIEYEHMGRIAALVEDVAVHVADLGHRVAVDKPKPEPGAPCRQ